MSETTTNTFIDECLAGRARPEDIEDFVEAWHESDSDKSIERFLGMSEDEYALWVEKPRSLAFILYSRRCRVPLQRAIEDASEMRMAARGATRESARELQAWLRRTGRVAK
jgi:hypothetical protein